MNLQVQRYAKTFGPGLIFASTAIGVSHLVQSTRAGAEFGFALIGFVILANLLKYPFFEFSSRYANATGTSIIDGYGNIGKHTLVFYLLVTIMSMFFVTAAVGLVTAGFLENLFQVEFLGIWAPVILFSTCAGILMVGRYRALDGLIKIIGSVLVVSTVTAFAIAFVNGPVHAEPALDFSQIWTHSGILFVIALMGWMPMPVDISSWHSLWIVERIRNTGFRPRLKETLFDFNSSYAVTSVLALLFVVLGAYLFFGAQEKLPDNSAIFANQVITLYTSTIGEWSHTLISASAFSIMFGTTIAVFDGYARSLDRCICLLKSKSGPAKTIPRSYVAFVLVLAAGSMLIIMQFKDSLTGLVDFATAVSFLIAPAIGILNFRLVTGKYLDKAYQPSLWLKMLAFMGIIFLVGFSGFFAATRFF